MKIRKAKLTDLRALQEIGALSYLPHYAHLWKPDGVKWYLKRCFNDQVLQDELTDSNIEYYFVEVNKVHIGFIKLVLLRSIPDSAIENALYLEKLYFIKEWTGKKVGRELMHFALERARELKRDCVWLMAMDTSAKPIAAYEKTGFVIHSRVRLDFELMKEEFRGMVVMKHCLNQNGN